MRTEMEHQASVEMREPVARPRRQWPVSILARSLHLNGVVRPPEPAASLLVIVKTVSSDVGVFVAAKPLTHDRRGLYSVSSHARLFRIVNRQRPMIRLA